MLHDILSLYFSIGPNRLLLPVFYFEATSMDLMAQARRASTYS